MQLLESGLQDAGKWKSLVPKAIDADDEDDPGESDDESDDDEVITDCAVTQQFYHAV